jgi:hypothetical protein
MNAVKFEQANVLMKRPPNMTEEQCADVPVCVTKGQSGIPVVISCWQLTEADIKQLRKTRRLYLGVMGTTMPPVFLDPESPFSPIIQPAAPALQHGGLKLIKP